MLQQCKIFENWLRFDKVTASLMVGTFLRHNVVTATDVHCSRHVKFVGYNVAAKFMMKLLCWELN